MWPSVALARLDELSRRIIVRDVEPEPMGDSSGSSFPQAKWVATDEISTFPVGIVQRVEEEWRGWSKQILDMLSQSIDLFSSWILSHLYPFIPILKVMRLLLTNVYQESHLPVPTVPLEMTRFL